MTNFFDMDYRNQDAYVKQATYIPGETGYRDEMPF
jgi:hypothetical protein